MLDRLLQSLGTKSKYYLSILANPNLVSYARSGFPRIQTLFFFVLNALFIALLLMNYLDQLLLLTSDKFELKFPELIQAELGRLRAELGHINFRAETELILSTSIGSKFLPHRRFSYFVPLS